MVRTSSTLMVMLLSASAAVAAEAPMGFEPAAAFGARASVTGLSLSPDGKSVAYVAPIEGQGAELLTLKLDGPMKPQRALIANGKPIRLEGCGWVASDRLVCELYALMKAPIGEIVPVSRVVAVNADGSNPRELSKRKSEYARGHALYGGGVFVWLFVVVGAVLLARPYLPDDHIGSHLGSSAHGLGVDRVDTCMLAVKHIESPAPDAIEYFSDGHGTIRVKASTTKHLGDQDTGVILYSYCLFGSRDWDSLGRYNSVDGSGMEIIAVDRDTYVAYSFKKKDGRRALYAVTLDRSLHEELVYARPDVDVDSVVHIGRRHHIVGAGYELDSPQASYFEPTVKSLIGSLSKAVPGASLSVTEASADAQKMLVFSGSARDPGVYYIFDRPAKKLQTFLVARAELEGAALAPMKAVSYPASDGTSIPAYLSLH